MFKRPAPSSVGQRTAKKLKLTKVPSVLGKTPITYTPKTSNRTEVKFIDGQFANFQVPDTGVVHVFGRVGEGDTVNDRSGRAIAHLGYEMRFLFSRSFSYQNYNVRMITGVYKQAYGGSAPPVLRIIERANILAPISASDSMNLVILGDEIVNMTAHASVGATETINSSPEDRYIVRKYSKKFIQEYVGNDTLDVANWTHFACFVAAQSALATGVVRYDVRNYFTDS